MLPSQASGALLHPAPRVRSFIGVPLAALLSLGYGWLFEQSGWAVMLFALPVCLEPHWPAVIAVGGQGRGWGVAAAAVCWRI